MLTGVDIVAVDEAVESLGAGSERSEQPAAVFPLGMGALPAAGARVVGGVT